MYHATTIYILIHLISASMPQFFKTIAIGRMRRRECAIRMEATGKILTIESWHLHCPTWQRRRQNTRKVVTGGVSKGLDRLVYCNMHVIGFIVEPPWHDCQYSLLLEAGCRHRAEPRRQWPPDDTWARSYPLRVRLPRAPCLPSIDISCPMTR